jgi:cyclopropane fatty-acyl-phospholipid synthase-like methyltransferase
MKSLIALSIILLSTNAFAQSVERFEKSGVALKKYVEVEQEYSASYFEARKKELDEKQAQLDAEYAELAKLEAEAVKLSVPTKMSELEVKEEIIEDEIIGK